MPETDIDNLSATVVTWDGDKDGENPQNWSFRRKWIAILTVSTSTFMSSACSSIVAPAETQIAMDLHVKSQIDLNLIFSIFLLGYVIGPLFLAPMSELYGRVQILRWSNLWFIVFCLACGFAQTPGQLIAFRLLAGMGASAPQTVGGGVLSDCFHSEERGKAVALYTLGPVLGPSIAPLCGGFIATTIGWRWGFWIIVLFGALVQVGLWFCLPETYAPRILTLKARRLRKEKSDPKFKSELELSGHGVLARLGHALERPLILVSSQVIVQFLALYLALVYGFIFLMLATFPRVWTEQYGESTAIGGLNYISISIGMLAGAQSGGYLLDSIYVRLRDRSPDKEGQPEFRIPLLVPGTLLLMTGLLIYGWTAEYRVHWIVPNIGAAIFSCGSTILFTVMQSYTIDAYPRFAASAIGVTAIARSLTGFGFPLFADAMFDALGYGWGNSVLALACVVIGLAGAAVLWFYGPTLRRASPYAAG